MRVQTRSSTEISHKIFVNSLNSFCDETSRTWASLSPETKCMISVGRLWVLAGFESRPRGFKSQSEVHSFSWRRPARESCLIYIGLWHKEGDKFLPFNPLRVRIYFWSPHSLASVFIPDICYMLEINYTHLYFPLKWVMRKFELDLSVNEQIPFNIFFFLPVL